MPALSEGGEGVSGPLIYIAGPYRGSTAWDVEKNIRAAEQLALRVWDLGGVAVCPHTMNRFFNGRLPDARVLPAMIALMRRCDAVAVTPIFAGSTGTSDELADAFMRRQPVFLGERLLGCLEDGKWAVARPYVSLADWISRWPPAKALPPTVEVVALAPQSLPGWKPCMEQPRSAHPVEVEVVRVPDRCTQASPYRCLLAPGHAGACEVP